MPGTRLWEVKVLIAEKPLGTGYSQIFGINRYATLNKSMFFTSLNQEHGLQIALFLWKRGKFYLLKLE